MVHFTFKHLCACSLCICRRYFTVAACEGAGGGNGGVSDVLATAQKLVQERKLPQAVSVLEEVVDQYQDSQPLWSLYLKLKAQLCTPTRLPELYTLLSKAITSIKSYTVVFEVSEGTSLHSSWSQPADVPSLCVLYFMSARCPVLNPSTMA